MPVIINKTNIFVPLKKYDTNWRIVYLDSNNTEQVIGDNTDTDNNRVISASFTRRSLRYGLGNFNLILDNEKGFFNSILQKGTTIRIFADHTIVSPTNQRFDGRIESIKHSLTTENQFLMSVYGRSSPQLQRHITKDFSTGANADAAIKAIIDDFFSGIFTYTNIDTAMTGTIYGEYINELAMSVIADILKQVSYDGYIDFSGDINTFPEGKRQNTKERIIYGDNMLAYSEIGKDFIDEINRMIVYGATDESTLLVRTANDTDLQNASWIKTGVMGVGNLKSINTVKQKAQVELDFKKQTPLLGTLSAANGLPTLLPGQNIFCSSQYGEINGFLPVVSYTDNLFQSGFWTTDVVINRLDMNILVDIRENEEKITAINAQNINSMDNTAILLKFLDTTQISSLGDLELSLGKLVIKSGSSTGTMTSTTEILANNVVSFEARAKVNDDCSISSFQVSNDGGLTFNDNDKSYNLVNDLNKLIKFTTTGKSIVAKITLTSNSSNDKPEVDNFTILVKS